MLIVGLIIFALLIIIHEFGHYWAARHSGVEVEEFGLGFPPRLLSRKFGKGKTRYSLNLIPLGGFVKLKGENSQDDRPHTFGAARFRDKTKILLAGVGMNVVAAFVMLTILGWVGLPQITEGQFTLSSNERLRTSQIGVASVVEDSPADEAGLKAGDKLLSIGGQTLKSAQELVDFTKSQPEETVSITWQNEEGIQNKLIKLAKSDQGEGKIGIAPYAERVVRYGWAAPLVALVLTFQLIALTFVGIGQLLIGLITEGGSSDAVAGAVGPVGILALLNNAGDFGIAYVMVLMVVISISLAVINVLPIPALDGGRLALIGIYRTLKRPLTEKVESIVHGAGFVALLALAVAISYFDIVRFF